MKGELVSVDGRVCEFWGGAPDELLAANYVYQKIAVFGRRAMCLEWAAEVVGAAYMALYGTGSEPSGMAESGVPAAGEKASGLVDGEGASFRSTGGANRTSVSGGSRSAASADAYEAFRGCGPSVADDLSREITALLDANDYPPGGGVVVAMYVFPDAAGRAVRLLSCEKQSAWREFSLTTGVCALTVPCEVPFAAFRTAASLSAQTCAEWYARRCGFDAAICENGDDVLATLGDAPLFAAADGRVFVGPSADSVERRMGIWACGEAGLELFEQPFTAADLPRFDEIFAVTPQGIASVGEVGGRFLPHSLASHLLTYMQKIRGR